MTRQGPARSAAAQPLPVGENEIILSLAYSPNTNNGDGGNYQQGAIIIGTSPSSPSNSTMGSIWVCDVSSNTVGNAATIAGDVNDPPWAIVAGVNLNYICSTGSTGVFMSNLLAYNPSSDIPQTALLVANNSSSSKHQWFADIVSACALVFGVVPDDPIAVGWALTGIVAQAADTGTGY